MAPEREPSFDYIVIGGGTAGLVVANRLSENPDISVAIIEAGEDASQDPRVTVPALFGRLFNSELSWGFATVPQEGLNDRLIGHPQGKLVGGSSAINLQAIIPFSASDIDAWEKLGNSGWNWNNLAPYIERTFSFARPDEQTTDHLGLSWAKDLAGNGPITSSFTDTLENPVGKAWVETFETLGHPITDSPFSGKSIGPYNAASTVDPITKMRSSAIVAYYQPVVHRKNLQVYINSKVEKIIIEDGRAIGVQVTSNGESTIVSANKEVILSAGVFNSPKILELSGIGDPEVLQSHGIEVKVENSGVGSNLQDHLLAGICFEVNEGVLTRDNLIRRDEATIKSALEQYQMNKSGPFAAPGISSFAFLPTVDFQTDKNALHKILEDLLAYQPSGPLEATRIDVLHQLLANGDEGTAQYFLLQHQTTSAGRDTTAGIGASPIEGNYITLFTSLSHPLSSGSSHIASADPLSPPVIDHKYLSNDIDLELHARHTRYLETIASTPPFSSLLKPNGRRFHPASFLKGDLGRAKEYVRLGSSSNFHSVGTCAMAPREKDGVVDERLRVYGVEGLRVVDASVIPLIVQSNLMTVVYAVAGRAGELIVEDGN
ncbi:GMC oxidoreductase [Amniculicola lignicola CBS 123094]|uniref:GMC oxidoreductase n=1 Tax=Amniculicola lignicola CBS 123094 TaxID=1392246 RepID=A0A6A5VZL6_9PLEO|nr:GMC oxidoreductase [Amniculicola lignicola CBS 123094]